MYGTVDSAINDLPAEGTPLGQPYNYCERQGRCILGCLPGARHTLNKQLMRAVLGTAPASILLLDVESGETFGRVQLSDNPHEAVHGLTVCPDPADRL